MIHSHLKTDLQIALHRARLFDVKKDVEKGRECLHSIWQSWDQFPMIEGFDEPTQAEILLRCGSLLSNYAYIHQTPNYNEKARDWLTHSHRIFSFLKLQNQIAETETEIALTYRREGADNDAVVWIETALSHCDVKYDYVKIKTISIFILILTCLKRYNEAFRLLESHEKNILKNADAIDKTHYYLNTALLLVESGKPRESLERLKKTIKYAEQSENLCILAIAENNIGNIYKDFGEFNKALESSYRSEKILTGLGDMCRVGYCYDSRAQIYLEMQNYTEALRCVDRGIEMLEQGSEFWAIVETLWTKTKILIQLRRTGEALTSYAKLYELARIRISEVSAKAYEEEFSKYFHIKTGKDFESKIHNYERELITDAAQETIELTAENLNINPLKLTSLIFEKHRELLELFEAQKEFDIVNLPSNFDISAIVKIPHNKLLNFGIAKDSIVIGTPGKIKSNRPIIVRDKKSNSIYCGLVDIYCGIVGLNTGDGEPVLFEETDIELLGIVAGYCTFDNVAHSYCFFELKI